MPRDYAKQNKGHRKSKSRKVATKPAIPAIYWIMTGVLVGLFIAGLVYMKSKPSPDITVAASEHHKKPAHTHPNTSAKLAPKPHFDFYTILPKMHLKTPAANVADSSINSTEKNAQPSTNTEQPIQSKQAEEEKFIEEQIHQEQIAKKDNPKEKTVSNNPAREQLSQIQNEIPHFNYLLQISVFPQYEQADKLKAQLTLMGFNVIIETTRSGGKSWHRVFVGPYKTTTDAEQAKHVLGSYNIKGSLYKTAG